MAFTPRDTVFVRDGRQFSGGVDATAEPTLPWPSTVGGAVRAAFGDRDVDRLRGPVLAQLSGDTWMPYFPVPADLVDVEDKRRFTRRLRPEPLPVTTDLGDACPQWLTGHGERIDGWIPAADLAAYLHGDFFTDTGRLANGSRVLEVSDPITREPRVGLARTPDRVAAEGYLYQSTHLRLRDGWGFLADCEGSGLVAQPGPVPLGGRGRLADIAVAPRVAWPDQPLTFPGGRVLVYLATPAIWCGGWRIPLPPDAELIAAAVAHAVPVASASPRLGMAASRMLRWAVPAGSVYLLKFPDAVRAEQWCARTHATAYGRDPGDRLASTGFGVVLTGVWS